MTIGIATFARERGVADIASTRIRVKWPLKYWPDAEEFRVGRRYDVIIFQKAYWLEYATLFQGIKILDLCDPDFLIHGGLCLAMVDRCDAVSCSSVALTEHLCTLTRTPVCTIPDRLDFETIGPLRKTHHGATRTAVWFGYRENQPLLHRMIDAVIAHGIPHLLVLTEEAHPFQLPPGAEGRLTLTNVPWRDDRAYHDLLRADVVLNPRGTEGRWRFKSDNKTVLAWALGLPVAHNGDELAALLTEEARRRESARRYDEVRQTSDVRQSVAEYRQLIARIGDAGR